MERMRTTPGWLLLDQILRTRTHVRVIRALVTHDGRDNLTGRDLARRAGMSHTSVIRVLPELEATGIVEARRVREYALYDLRQDHFLAPSLSALFDDEVHVDESLIQFVRRRARDRGWVMQVRLKRSVEGEAFLTLNGRDLEGFEARMWIEGLQDELAEMCGETVDIAVEARTPSALRGLMD